MKQNCYAVIMDWALNDERGMNVNCVCLNKDDAIDELKKRVDVESRHLAEANGLEIIEDTKECFDAGIMGEYDANHVLHYIQLVVLK